MGSKDQDLGASSGGGGGFFSSVAAGVPDWGTAVRKSVNGMVGYEGLEVINPDGGADDAEAEVMRGQWKQELHGLYQSTLRTSVRGSLSVPSLERRMRWLTIRALHLLLSRQNSWETQWKCVQLEVTLKKSGVVLELVPPLTKVNNLIFGRTWVDSPGECHDKSDNWRQSCAVLPAMRLVWIWKVAPTPPNDKYQCTYFAHRINNFDRAPKKLLPSDF